MKGGAGARDFFEDARGVCSPDGGLWILVVEVDESAEGHVELFEALEVATPNLVCVRSRKNRSILLSHEAEVGAKCTRKGLWLSSQRWTRGRFWVA